MQKLTHAVVLDDHRLFADSFALLLQRTGNIDVVQSFSETEDFFQFLRSFGTANLFVFLDYYFPNENGLTILTEIRRINGKAKIIFVTSASAPAVVRSILQYRPQGLLSKFGDIQTLSACITAVKKNTFFVHPDFQRLMLETNRTTVTFTPREIELLKYFSQGYSIAETAAKTFLSPHTIVAHRRKMMAKAKCHSIAEMLTYARDNDLI